MGRFAWLLLLVGCSSRTMSQTWPGDDAGTEGGSEAAAAGEGGGPSEASAGATADGGDVGTGRGGGMHSAGGTESQAGTAGLAGSGGSGGSAGASVQGGAGGSAGAGAGGIGGAAFDPCEIVDEVELVYDCHDACGSAALPGFCAVEPSGFCAIGIGIERNDAALVTDETTKAQCSASGGSPTPACGSADAITNVGLGYCRRLTGSPGMRFGRVDSSCQTFAPCIIISAPEDVMPYDGYAVVMLAERGWILAEQAPLPGGNGPCPLTCP